MAGNAAAWRNFLENSFGLSVAQSAAFINQGYHGPDTLVGATDDDIATACRNCQRPGGTIPNPAYVLPAAGNPNPNPPNVPQNIPNPGVELGHGHQKRLQMLAFWCNYIDWTNRTWVPNQANLANLTRLYNFKQQLDADVEAKMPKFPEKFADLRKSREALEDMDQWINSSFGDKFPLAFVVRDEMDHPLGNDYPVGVPSYNDDLINRLTIVNPNGGFHPDYVSHNGKVWEMVYDATHGTNAWAWVKGFKTTRDGRGAMISLKAHFLGDSHVNSVKTAADATLTKTFWDGKARSFTWERFTSTLTDAFTDLADHGEPKSDAEKVRKLLSAIRDPNLRTAKATVMATAHLLGDYNEALNFFKGQLDLMSLDQTSSRNRNISELSRAGDGGPGRHGRGTGRGGGRGRGRGRSSGDNRSRGRGRGGRDGRGGGAGRGGGRFSASGYLLNNGGYPSSVWETFTREEQQYVNRLRDTPSSTPRTPSRNVSEVESASEPPPAQRVRFEVVSDNTPVTPTQGTSMMRSGSSRSN
jgi:hypothetical protein